MVYPVDFHGACRVLVSLSSLSQTLVFLVEPWLRIADEILLALLRTVNLVALGTKWAISAHRSEIFMIFIYNIDRLGAPCYTAFTSVPLV
jgi:hypothetical protein